MTVNSITSTGGDLTLTADEMVITGPVNATAQDVFLQASSGTGFDLGSAGDVAANTVELSDAELNAITANSLIIGDSSAGDVDISASVMSAPAFTTLVLRTAGAVDDGVSGALLNNRNRRQHIDNAR